MLKAWFGSEATDDFIWKVCHLATVDDEPQEGWNELPLLWRYRNVAQMALTSSPCLEGGSWREGSFIGSTGFSVS